MKLKIKKLVFVEQVQEINFEPASEEDLKLVLEALMEGNGSITIDHPTALSQIALRILEKDIQDKDTTNNITENILEVIKL